MYVCIDRERERERERERDSILIPGVSVYIYRREESIEGL
jgi:hypothetical protein